MAWCYKQTKMCVALTHCKKHIFFAAAVTNNAKKNIIIRLTFTTLITYPWIKLCFGHYFFLNVYSLLFLILCCFGEIIWSKVGDIKVTCGKTTLFFSKNFIINKNGCKGELLFSSVGPLTLIYGH